MPFSTPGEKIRFMISGLVGLKRIVRGESIDALRRTKAGSEMALPLFCEFQIAINTVVVYKKHSVVGVTYGSRLVLDLSLPDGRRSFGPPSGSVRSSQR
jgi:hypothetical protein